DDIGRVVVEESLESFIDALVSHGLVGLVPDFNLLAIKTFRRGLYQGRPFLLPAIKIFNRDQPPAIVRIFGNHFPGLLEDQVSITEQRRVHREVPLKHIGSSGQRVMGKRSALRMTDQRPQGLGAVSALNKWDQLISQKGQEIIFAAFAVAL